MGAAEGKLKEGEDDEELWEDVEEERNPGRRGGKSKGMERGKGKETKRRRVNPKAARAAGRVVERVCAQGQYISISISA